MVTTAGEEALSPFKIAEGYAGNATESLMLQLN
jgi:hypothetical protein